MSYTGGAPGQGQVYNYHRPGSANSNRAQMNTIDGQGQHERYGSSYANSAPGPSSPERQAQQPMQQQHSQNAPHDYSSASHDTQVQEVSVLEDDDSIMSSESDFESDPQLAMAMDPEQQHFYAKQQEQARHYMKHQRLSGGVAPQGGYQARIMNGEKGKERRESQGVGEDDDDFSDDGSSAASIPDEEIDFGLTYALHTFLATVEGQASVVKGDSLLLLDDANSYWWLVRVLKTEDVGYIPAENIETPYERLARLNKHRNVDLATATEREKVEAEERVRQRTKGGSGFASKAFGMGNRNRSDRASANEGGPRRVEFAPPTYVDHPGKTWSSDEEDTSDEEEGDEADRSLDQAAEEGDEEQADAEQDQVEASLGQRQSGNEQQQESDDGVEWADQAAEQVRQDQSGQYQEPAQQQQQQHQQQTVQPKSNNPFAQPRAAQTQDPHVEYNRHDPAQAGEDTRRITVTPTVAQGGSNNGVLLPSAVVSNGQRNASNQSLVSTNSSSSNHVGSNQESPDNQKRSAKIRKSGSQDSLNSVEGKKDKKRGIISGLFSRKNKDKKGVSSSDPRGSEDSFGGGGQQQGDQAGRGSEESKYTVRAPTPAEPSADSPRQASHSLRLQQTDQQRMQAYTDKYLANSPNSSVRAPTATEAAAAVAQSAAAMRLAASMNGVTNNRPSSIIVSPNPAAPLLNVMRVFAGEHVKSDASFKTVLVNDTTTAGDLIRQAIQRFRLRDAMNAGAEAGYFLCVRDVIGEELELEPDEKPLQVFLDAVQRWSDENGIPDRASAITPTVKRSSVASISSVMSLSSHPAIAKLGMNDFSDDSAVKIYLHRRRPGSLQFGQGGSEYSSYASQLSTVHEGSPERQERHKVDGSDSGKSGGQRFNPSLSVNTGGAPSPERFSSPSARFTVQMAIYPPDLPDGMVFDPTTDAIITKQVLRDRLMAGHPTHTREIPSDSRRRLFMLPRNATVVEAIEQGLGRFGINDGVVDGGDDVEERGGKGKSSSRVRYCLTVNQGGKDTILSSSSKLLDAYSEPPVFKPVERSTPEQKRRSREWSYGLGAMGDILPTDPVFVIRRSGRPTSDSKQDLPKGVLRQQQALATAAGPGTAEQPETTAQMSPHEIIAAQRAAYRANQSAILSAQSNKSQGVDVLLPDRGTLRSSRLLEPTGEVVRYSYIDDYGETYDISELLEEEWKEGSPDPENGYFDGNKPAMQRKETDRSEYVTAPSTPADGADIGRRGSVDLLAGAIERSAGKPEGKLQEKLARVIDKVKSKGAPQIRPANSANTNPGSSGGGDRSGATTPTLQNGRPSSRTAAAQFAENHRRDGRGDVIASASPSNVDPRMARSASRQAQMDDTAASVNKIVSRHRQQPSIASIMSMSDATRSAKTSSFIDDAASDSTVTRGGEGDASYVSRERERERERDRASTPLTATSSTHPTPPLGSAIFTRAVATMSPTPREPIKYTDDFGMKTLIGLVEARAREMRPRPPKGSSGASTGLGPSSAENKAGKRMSRASSSGSSSGARSAGVITPQGSDLSAKDEAAVKDVTCMFWGDRIDRYEVDQMHPEVKAGVQGVMLRLDAWDREVDDLLGSLGDLMGVKQGQVERASLDSS